MTVFRGIIVTIGVHKFTGYERFAVARANVIGLIDEAHRSQEGDFGKWMRATLPAASLFGFTGTPIENDDHNTPMAFGRIIGKDASGTERVERYMQPGGRYTIADAIRDGATIPIHFRSESQRLVGLGEKPRCRAFRAGIYWSAGRRTRKAQDGECKAGGYPQAPKTDQNDR